jgi:hypothetical protein
MNSVAGIAIENGEYRPVVPLNSSPSYVGVMWEPGVLLDSKDDCHFLHISVGINVDPNTFYSVNLPAPEGLIISFGNTCGFETEMAPYLGAAE